MWQGATGAGAVVIAALALALGRSGPARADIVVHPRAEPRATVLVMHPGGWVYGSATTALPAARYLARHGYRAVSLDYPLLDVRRSYRYARWAVHRYRATFAVGESSGGTIASWLAARRCVRAAVAVSAPQDLPLWAATSAYPTYLPIVGLPSGAWEWSPARRYSPRSAPLLGVYWDGDPFVPLEQGRLIARRGARLRVLAGDEHAGSAYYPAALRFIRRR